METTKTPFWLKTTEYFSVANPNPAWLTMKRAQRWDREDCAIRALALSARVSWLEAFDFLTAKARRDFNVPNDMGGFRRWLCEAGGVWNACKAVAGKKRLTALEFTQKHPKGAYILQVANHLCAVVDGKMRDTWNCGEKCVFGYFDMEGFDITK